MHIELDTVLKRTIFVFATLTLVLIVFVAKFESITDPNVADCAQIARHVARGEGFTTSAISPLSLSVVPRVDRHPELTRPPLYVSVLAVAMLVGGANDKTVGITSTLLFLLTLVLTYVVARRAFSDQVGIFAVLVCVLSAPLLAQITSGADTALLTLLVTLLFGHLFWREQALSKDAPRWPIVSGLLLGLCYLTRYETAALVPAVACYYWLSYRRAPWRRLSLLLGCFLLTVLPWVVRSSLLAGRPFISLSSYELIMLSDFQPLQTLYRVVGAAPPSPWLEALRNPLDMLKKFNEGLQTLYSGVSQLANPFVMPFFVVGLLLGAIRRRFSLLQWCLMLALALQVVSLCLYMPLTRLLLPFTPLVAILAVAWFCSLLDDYLQAATDPQRALFAARRRFLALVAWTVIVGYPFTSYVFTSPAAREHPIVRVCQKLGEREARLIASDLPWFVAWYGNRTALLLPTSPADLPRLRAMRAEPDVVYLSPGLLQMPAEEGLSGWQELLARQGNLPGFKPDEWRLGGAVWRREGPPKAAR